MKSLCIFWLVLAAALALAPSAVHGQGAGLFDSLFGPRVRIPTFPTQERSAPGAEPVQPRLRITVIPRTAVPQAAYGYCVRLCDGRYFPLPRLVRPRASAQTLCRALCPAAATALFVGATIETAVNADRVRYATLATAYQFRKTVATDCTCNGVDPLGTAAVSVYHDITLHPGDIVVAPDGMRVFDGTRSDIHSPEFFVALDEYPRISPNLREQLAGLRIDAGSTKVSDEPKHLPEPLTVRARIFIGFDALTTTSTTSPRVIPLTR